MTSRMRCRAARMVSRVTAVSAALAALLLTTVSLSSSPVLARRRGLILGGAVYRIRRRRRDGREAEGDGLLNRYTGSNPYPGFESPSLRWSLRQKHPHHATHVLVNPHVLAFPLSCN